MELGWGWVEDRMRMLIKGESTYLTMTLVSGTLVMIASASGTLASGILGAETMAVSFLALRGIVTMESDERSSSRRVDRTRSNE